MTGQLNMSKPRLHQISVCHVPTKVQALVEMFLIGMNWLSVFLWEANDKESSFKLQNVMSSLQNRNKNKAFIPE